MACPNAQIHIVNRFWNEYLNLGLAKSKVIPILVYRRLKSLKGEEGVKQAKEKLF